MKFKLGLSVFSLWTIFQINSVCAQTVTTVLGSQYQGSGQDTGQSNVATADELLMP